MSDPYRTPVLCFDMPISSLQMAAIRSPRAHELVKYIRSATPRATLNSRVLRRAVTASSGYTQTEISQKGVSPLNLLNFLAHSLNHRIFVLVFRTRQRALLDYIQPQ